VLKLIFLLIELGQKYIFNLYLQVGMLKLIAKF